MLQYYPPICDLRHINFTKIDFMNETSKIGLSHINSKIINTPKLDNRGHELQHITPCYSIIQQRLKYQFGQNFTVLTSITSSI